MNNKKVKIFLKAIFSIILVVGIAYFINSKKETLSNIINIQPLFLLSLIACHLVNFFLLGLIFHEPLKKLGINLGFNQWFGLTAVSNLFNLFLPAKGGNALRWYYLRDNNGLRTKTFLSINFLTTVIGMLSMGILGFFFLEFAPTGLGIINQIAKETFFIMGTAASVILLLSFREIKLLKVLKNIPHEINCSRVYLIVFISFTIITLLYPIRAYFSYQALGIELSILQTTQLSVFLLIASLVPVLPGNIGIKEVVMAHIASKFGIMPEVAILATLFERASLYMMVLPLGLGYYFHLILGVKNTTTKFDRRVFSTRLDLAELENIAVQPVNIPTIPAINNDIISYHDRI